MSISPNAGLASAVAAITSSIMARTKVATMAAAMVLMVVVVRRMRP